MYRDPPSALFKSSVSMTSIAMIVPPTAGNALPITPQRPHGSARHPCGCVVPVVVGHSVFLQTNRIDDHGALRQSPIEPIEFMFESVFELVFGVWVLSIPDAFQKLVLKGEIVHGVSPLSCCRAKNRRRLGPCRDAMILNFHRGFSVTPLALADVGHHPQHAVVEAAEPSGAALATRSGGGQRPSFGRRRTPARSLNFHRTRRWCR